jgi:membrane-bound lytic murein transglycosylase D
VRRGDTLYGIARHYRMSARTLARMNGISVHHLLRPGEKLRLYANVPVEHHGELRFQVVRVRTGDTLWSIARRHGMSAKSLANLNGLARGEVLRPGQRLKLYTHAPRRKSSSSGSLAAGPTQDSANGGAAVRNVVYTVRSGDTLWQIAHLFQVKVTQILAWNAIKLHTRLLAGQKLRIRVSDAGI